MIQVIVLSLMEGIRENEVTRCCFIHYKQFWVYI